MKKVHAHQQCFFRKRNSSGGKDRIPDIGAKELPVEDVLLRKVTTSTIKGIKHIHENVADFREEE